MSTSERLIDAAAPIAKAIRSPEDVRRARRVDRAIDDQGNVVMDDLDFLPFRSPDGSRWRLRVDNSGAVVVTPAPAL